MFFEIVSIFLILSSLLVKYKFILLEDIYRYSFVGIMDVLSTFLMTIILMTFFIKGLHRNKRAILPKNKPNSFIAIIGFFAVVFVLVVVCLFNYNKKSLDWDAVALYDARAKFIQEGMNFSDMQTLSDYDINNNKYYYSLYPPYTSILHYYWNNFFDNVPVSFLYAIFFVVFAVGIFSFGAKHIGFAGAVMFVFLVVSNKNVFLISLLEYTNLPFMIFVTLGTLSLFKFLTEKKDYLVILGSLLIGGSIWIRFLEPVWFAILLSFAISLLRGKNYISKKVAFLFLIGLFYILVQYFSWSFFQKFVAKSPTIFEINVWHILNLFAGFFTGYLLNVFLFFAKSMGISFIILTPILFQLTKRENREYFFLRLTIFSSLLMYFIGMYSISFLFDWWKELSGSLVRSSTYLVPLAVLLWINNLKYLLKQYFLTNKKNNVSIKCVISNLLRS